MRNQKTFHLVLTSLFVAIIIIMAFTPLGYIPLVIINATIIHIPVILGSLFCGPKRGAFLGFVFGTTSFIKNTLMPTSLSAFVFSPILAADIVGPSGILRSFLICFVPRILVGVLPYFVYRLIQKITASDKKLTYETILNLFIFLIVWLGSYGFLNKVFEANITSSVSMMVALFLAAVFFAVLQFILIKKDTSLLAFIYAALSGALINTFLVMGGIYFLYKDAYAKAIGVSADAVLGIIGGVISFNGVIEAIVAAIIVTAVGMILKRMQPIE